MEWESTERVRKLFAQQERRIGRFFDLAVKEYLADLDIARLEDLILRGRLLDALDDIRKIAIATANANQQAFIAAGNATSAYIQSGSIATVGFDVVNHLAVSAMERNHLDFVKDFDEKQVRATRAAIQGGIKEGVGPREMARRFRGSIGLTEYQQGTVRNYERLLQRIGADDVARSLQREPLSRTLRDRRSDSVIQRAIRQQKPLQNEEIARMVERYRGRLIKKRSQDIARTEALHSVHAGRSVAMEQAVQSGAFDPSQLQRKWNVGSDGRQRLAHDELRDVVIGYGEVYVNSLGEIARPGDRSAVAANVINCRCVETFRIRRISKRSLPDNALVFAKRDSGIWTLPQACGHA